MTTAPAWRERLAVNDVFTLERTVTEADVYAFAGITGDQNRVHINERYMAETRYGQRLVHGAYLLGLISAASTKLIEASGGFAVAYGHDRVRFLLPTYFGDTVLVRYEISEISAESGRVVSNVTVSNHRGEDVAVASHLLYFIDERQDAVQP